MGKVLCRIYVSVCIVHLPPLLSVILFLCKILEATVMNRFVIFGLFFNLALFLPSRATADWKPPANPHPEAIFQEARADARAGNFENALAKYVWYFQHAREYKDSLGSFRVDAIRESFELGKKYPPAMARLRELRDSVNTLVLIDAQSTSERKSDDEIRSEFNDLSNINEVLGDFDQTVATFLQLEGSSPRLAKIVYVLAEEALIKTKKFSTCDKYLDPEKDYARIVHYYRFDIKFADEGKEPGDIRRGHIIAESSFIESGSTLIALLVVNNRKPEAEKIANKLRNDSQFADRNAVIDAALKGEFPPRQVGLPKANIGDVLKEKIGEDSEKKRG
jgi:hypothetical protein